MSLIYPTPEEQDRLARWQAGYRVNIGPGFGLSRADPFGWCRHNELLVTWRRIFRATRPTADTEPLYLGGGEPLGPKAVIQWVEREMRG